MKSLQRILSQLFVSVGLTGLTKYFEARDKNCIDTMLPEWEGKLMGARTFMPTNCFAMAEAATINPSVSAILQNSTMAIAGDQPSYP